MRRRLPQPSAKPSASLYEEVRSTKRPLVITKRGKPVAKRVPTEEAKRRVHRPAEGRVQSGRRPRCRSAGGVGVRVLILLDTHSRFWVVNNSEKLSRPATSAIRRRHGGIAISAISR